MVALVVGMLVCVGLAIVVVGVVAVPARREGRGLLTPRGEEMVSLVRDRTESTIERSSELIGAVRDRGPQDQAGERQAQPPSRAES
jgi:hypothetical protein